MNAATNNTSPVQQLTQGAAVIQAVKSVLKGDYKLGVKVTLTDDQRKAITEVLVKGFTDRSIALKASPANEAKLKDQKLLAAYVKGLIVNWLTKSPELNGKPKAVKAAAPVATATSTPTSAATDPVVDSSKSEAKVTELPKSGKDSGTTAPAKKPTMPGKK